MTPVCKYCGVPMIAVETVKGSVTTVCPGCGARGPIVHGMGDRDKLKEKAVQLACKGGDGA